MGEIICRIIELPRTVNAVTVVDENADYNVYVNALLSEEAQKAAFQHEKRHIQKVHFWDESKSVLRCEQEAENGRGSFPSA